MQQWLTTVSDRLRTGDARVYTCTRSHYRLPYTRLHNYTTDASPEEATVASSSARRRHSPRHCVISVQMCHCQPKRATFIVVESEFMSRSITIDIYARTAGGQELRPTSVPCHTRQKQSSACLSRPLVSVIMNELGLLRAFW